MAGLAFFSEHVNLYFDSSSYHFGSKLYHCGLKMPKIRSEKKSRVHQDVQKQGIQFNKDLGQHILKNPLVITTMIEKVGFWLDFVRLIS